MYYIKASNTKTGQHVIMSIPTFTNKKKAERFAKQFEASFATPVAHFEVIKQ